MTLIDRKTLHEQVWTIPGARLAPLYGLSDVGLAKICRRHKIPRPPRGYWAKLAAGRPQRKTPLPKLRGCLDDNYLIFEWNMPNAEYELNVAIQPGVAQQPTLETATSPHELVVATQSQLAAMKTDQNGLLRSDATQALDVRVSPATLSRCLALFDGLIRKWEARGGQVRMSTRDGGKTALVVREDEVYVRIEEQIDDSKPVSDPTRLRGRLSAQLYGPNVDRKWADGKSQRLEKVLSTLIATAVDTIQRAKVERLDKECIQRQVARVEALRGAHVQAINEQFSQRQKLMEYAHRWRDAELIRGYLAALQAAINANKVHPIHEEKFCAWFEWATLYANSIDPILEAQLPEEAMQGPTNTLLAELDLTSRTRATATSLNVKDSDDLSRVKPDQIRDRFGYFSNETWNEVTRVLEVLGYEVAIGNGLPFELREIAQHAQYEIFIYFLTATATIPFCPHLGADHRPVDTASLEPLK